MKTRRETTPYQHSSKMRLPLLQLLALTTSTTTALTLDFHPFIAALPPALLDYIPTSLSNNTTPQKSTADQDLLKRQFSNTCPEDFNSCANLGAPQYCCAPNAICSADFAGHVACCPAGAACSGTIGGIITEGTVNSNGALVGGGAAAAPTGDSADGNGGLATVSATTTEPFGSAQTDGGLVLATTPGQDGDGDDDDGDSGGFVLDGSQTVATPGAGRRRFEAVSLLVCVWNGGIIC